MLQTPQNSIRHNLSLNPAFRKVKDSMRWQGKKGYYWEVVPERRASVEREVERYLRQEGRLKDLDINDGSEQGVAIPSWSCWLFYNIACWFHLSGST